jgi:hypothetical protein
MMSKVMWNSGTKMRFPPSKTSYTAALLAGFEIVVAGMEATP